MRALSIPVLRHGCALVLTMLATTSSLAAGQPVPAAAFFDSPHVGAAKLSPDGRHLAMLVHNDKGRDQLGVVTLADGATKVVATFADADVGRFEWVNNGRLLYDSRDNRTAQGELRYANGLFAVNADGSDYRELAEINTGIRPPDAKRRKLPLNTFMLGQAGAQDSEAVYVTTFQFGPNSSISRADLIRVNTVTGASTTVEAPGHPRAWWLDAQGRPALVLAIEGGMDALYYRDPASGDWRKLASKPHLAYVDDDVQAAPVAGADPGVSKVVVNGRREPVLDFTPLGFTPAGELYVVSHRRRDKDALFAYDLATRNMAARPLVDLDAYDFSGSLVTSATSFLGVRYTVDAESTAWFDPAMKAAQQAVDKLLPGRVNVLSVGARSETPFVLVESWSDRQPSVFMLFDRATGKLQTMGETRPAIAPSRMARQMLVQVKARDGRTIPAWLTVPDERKAGKAPMVVLVHGGPQVRGGAWGWDDEAQFLASRGYVVLQPEYRGSAGYGQAHFRAGWKQWGLAMQDDVADATRWAVAEGIADPRRVCIGGAGYGGYAALMGLIRDPGLYQCGIDLAGVTDIGLLYSGHWTSESDLPDDWKRAGLSVLVGDPDRDAAQFAATSPLKQAARITQPVLLAYGDDDRRVPAYHGRLLADALAPTNKNVEWIAYRREGHGQGLVYGGDEAVPDSRGRMFYDAIRQSGNAFRESNRDVAALYDQSVMQGSSAPVAEVPGMHDSFDPLTRDDVLAEWIGYEKEGRGWGLAETRVAYWTRVEQFLARQIGDGAAKGPTAAR